MRVCHSFQSVLKKIVKEWLVLCTEVLCSPCPTTCASGLSCRSLLIAETWLPSKSGKTEECKPKTCYSVQMWNSVQVVTTSCVLPTAALQKADSCHWWLAGFSHLTQPQHMAEASLNEMVEGCGSYLCGDTCFSDSLFLLVLDMCRPQRASWLAKPRPWDV